MVWSLTVTELLPASVAPVKAVIWLVIAPSFDGAILRARICMFSTTPEKQRRYAENTHDDVGGIDGVEQGVKEI